jgi:hypothetical protein
MMKKSVAIGALAVGFTASGATVAASVEDELAAIKARLATLEQQVQDQNAVIREKDRQIMALSENPALQGKGGSSGGGWFRNVEIGGIVEIEAGYNDPYTGDSTSDVVVATAEIGIAAQINDWTAAEITALYEEDDTPLEIDVAIVTIAHPDGPWFVTAGQQYVPFGTYETNLLSDPLTLEIGETRETAILAGMESNGFYGGVYVFNGDNKENGDDRIDNFGAFVGFASENDVGEFSANLGYINDIGDSDGLQGVINDTLGNNDVMDHVGGWTVDAMFRSGPFVVIAEYTRASDSFDATEISFGGSGAQPEAFNIEAGYDFNLLGRDATVAVGYQGTDEASFDAGGDGLPEERLLAAVSVGVMENTTVTFEIARDEDYSVADGGTGKKATTATAQLAVEF